MHSGGYERSRCEYVTFVGPEVAQEFNVTL